MEPEGTLVESLRRPGGWVCGEGEKGVGHVTEQREVTWMSEVLIQLIEKG